MARFITCDLDYTLCDTRKRDVEFDPFNVDNPERATVEFWEAYHARCVDDEPIRKNVQLITDLAIVYEVVFVSNRSTSARQLTIDWLTTHVPIWGLNRWPMDRNHHATSHLILHPPSGLMTDPVGAKVRNVRHVAAARRNGFHVMHIDDQQPVITQLAYWGLTGVLVTP